MEMINKKESEKRRRLFAVAIFFGLSATTVQSFAAQTGYIYSEDSPVVEMAFFNANEFTSAYNFTEPLIRASKFSASYWKNLLDLQANSTPWQIAFTTSNQQIIDGETFSFRDATSIQDNYLAQMLQGRKVLSAFDLQSLASEKISASEVQAFLQNNSPLDDAALSVVTVGNYLGATRNKTVRGWSVDENTILPTNEQAADLVGALRLEMAHALDVHDAKNFIVTDKVYFVGNNVSEILGRKTFDGVRGIPLNGTFNETLIPGLMSGLPYKNYSTFTELELAALQDMGYDIDRKKFYGRSIYSSGNVLTNSTTFASGEPLAVGLHVWSAENNINQSGNISLTGNGAVGIRVDGLDNQISIKKDTTIESSGLRGKGVLISYGRGHDLNVDGNILAAGNAVEFNFGSNMLGASGEYRGSYLRYLRGVDSAGNIVSGRNPSLRMTDSEFNYAADELNGALVDNFNLSGTIKGDEHAIYIGKNSFVKNININSGANVIGNIVSDWKHFTAADGFSPNVAGYPIRIQYDGKLIDAGKYIPDLTTNLNFNTSINYGGNISGADNIKMHVNTGELNFWGAADVLSVDVMRGAKIFGGTFTLNNQSNNLAEGFSDTTTGIFVNHGTIGANSPDTNLVINGDLISDGFLQKSSGGEAGSIIVNGTANVEGSTVTTNSLLPDETETVLIAESITGNIKNPAGNPVPISAMLNATGEIVGNTLTVTTSEANNLCDLNKQEFETFDAMNNMFDNLEGNIHQEEMRDLYNLEPPEAKKSLKEIGSNDSAKIMSVAQQNTAVDKMVADRVAKIFSADYIDTNTMGLTTEYVDFNVHPTKFADDDTNDTESVMKVKVKVPKRQENNFWLNYIKNWGELRGGTDYHGSVIVGGYDRPFGKKWRAGIFATYGTIGYGAESSRATVYDTRLGLYAGYHNRASDVYFYINGGQLRNSLHRGISSLGLSTNAKYNSRIIEIGGEYKYDLSPKKKWHISPFVNFQASHLKQNGYQESGAGVFNQHVESDSNTYFAAQTGIDLKRYYRHGMFGFRLGVKHGFTGADPALRIRYEGDNGHTYRLRQERDKTHFVCSLRGENEFARGWYIGGETEFQMGEHDRDVTASITFRRMW